MTDKIVISALLSMIFAAPCAAGQNKTIPKVEGGSVALDPHVAEFEQEMKTAISSLIAVRTAVQAVVIPPISKSGALAAGVKAAGEFAATASIMAAAEAAHQKFLTHLMGFQADELDIKLKLTGPAFDQKSDANVKPKADKIMQGNFSTASAGGGGGSGVSRVAAPAASAPKFAPVSSPFSYGSGGGTQFGMGFEGTLGGGTQGGAAGDINAGGQSMGGGGGVATGAADRASAGSTSTGAPDVKPGANPTELSKNTSDVAQKAAERMKERQEAAEQAAEKREQDAKQRKQQQQQMMMQAGQMAAQVGGQLAQAIAANQEKQGEAAQGGATNPLP